MGLFLSFSSKSYLTFMFLFNTSWKRYCGGSQLNLSILFYRASKQKKGNLSIHFLSFCLSFRRNKHSVRDFLIKVPWLQETLKIPKTIKSLFFFNKYIGSLSIMIFSDSMDQPLTQWISPCNYLQRIPDFYPKKRTLKITYYKLCK